MMASPPRLTQLYLEGPSQDEATRRSGEDRQLAPGRSPSGLARLATKKSVRIEPLWHTEGMKIGPHGYVIDWTVA